MVLSKLNQKAMLQVGLISGGQLGLMIIQELLAYPVEIHVLDTNRQAPCARFADHFTQAKNLLDAEEVFQFGKNLDLILLEFEHVSVEGLKQLKEAGVRILPDPEVLAVIQDKAEQKQFLVDQKLPTAPFVKVKAGEDLSTIESLRFKFPAVLKSRKEGYDGNGVQIYNERPTTKTEVRTDSILEQKINFERELSVLVCRSDAGEIDYYPIVQQDFHPEANLVELISAPAPINDLIVQNAQVIAKKIVEAFDYVGVMAVELFMTANGELFVNELAPRVHNSGHHTIEANVTSQFAQQVRLGLGFDLGSTAMVSPAATVNLLGSENAQGEAHYLGMDGALQADNHFIHIYQKQETRPFRKMGHLTVLADSVGAAEQDALKLQQQINITTLNQT